MKNLIQNTKQKALNIHKNLQEAFNLQRLGRKPKTKTKKTITIIYEREKSQPLPQAHHIVEFITVECYK